MTDTSRHATRQAKSYDELRRYQRRRRYVLALLIGLIFLALLFVRSEAAPGQALHEYMEWIGGVLILVAILGRTWCTLYIGGRKSAEIVTEGPYSVTRNPLYVFSAIGAAGIGAMTGSIIIALAFAVLTWLAFLAVIQVEERFLEQNFGDPYLRYMEQVPRFFPKPWLFRESEMLAVKPKLLYRTFTDGLFFVLAFPFFELVEGLQEAGILPVILHVW